MKKLLFSTAFLVFINVIYSQNTKETNIDSMLVNLDTSTLTSTFLYDRTSAIADLKNFNTSEKNVATLPFFEQALQELYKASNQKKFMSYKSAREYYAFLKNYNQVEIGVIHTTFQSLNYNDDVSKSALKMEDQKLIKINQNPLFLDHEVLIVAPLLQYAVGPTINYRFNTNLWFENANNPIQSLVADFGTGTAHIIYNNGHYTQKELAITYSETGMKSLTFIVTYQDGTKKTTYGKIHIKLSDTSYNREDDLIDNGTIVSTIPFQGYDEPSPIYGQLDYRIFYHTNNGNAQRTLLKPIVIIDGFDPGDKRQIQDSDPHPTQSDGAHNSIEEIMTYFENGNRRFLIPVLRELGYDVVIVNHPKYIRTVNGAQKTIDGGADYIERNGYNHVTLYNYLNSTLLTNDSSEQLVIVGPSMGGQISRYALSYMEKNNMNHNVRLWVSIDSPHLGANIPVGAQALINLLNDETDSVGAADFVENWLGSPAAKQQLIEQYSGRNDDDLKQEYFNAKTVSQGFSENRGHPFFVQFYNNLYANGLPNSKGYPQNMRKIAIVNGALSGTRTFANPFANLSIDPGTYPRNDNFATHGTKVLKIEGNANVIGHIVTVESYFMQSPNYNHKLAYFKKKKFGGWNYHHRYGTNINSRGTMDNISGGWYPTQRDLAESILGSSSSEPIFGDFTNWSIAVNNWNINNLEHVSSFIPTVSALGFSNPDFNWGKYIDTKLLCGNDIPFDTFYAPYQNEQHTSFTQSSVNWLIQELAGNPQPIHGSHSNPISLIGTSTAQECQTIQFQAPFVYNATNYVWTINGDNNGNCDWQIVSGQGSRYLTVKFGRGFGVVTCRPQGSCGTGDLLYKNLQGQEMDCGSRLTVSPNPNKGESITIGLKYPPDDPCHQDPTLRKIDPRINGLDNLWIYDFYGNMIYKSSENKNVVVLNDLKLKAGFFVVKRMNIYGEILTEKLIVK